MKQISLMKKSEEELTKFLLEDTENYTKLSNSLSGRIFEMEEKIVAQDKMEIARLEKELENSGIVLSKELEEIENLKPSGSAFARLGLGSRKKKLLAEAEKRFEDKQTILQNRLKNARKVYEKDRILLQELINKLDAKGIVWHELKRILSEKIAQGFFVHEKLTRQKQKKEEDNLYISKAQKTTKLRGETKDGEGGRTFKEKNVIGRYDFYKIKGLTAAEKKEYEEISVICTAPSKTFNIAGLQVSNIFIPNPVLRDTFKMKIKETGYGELNAMGLIACETAYRDGDEWYEVFYFERI